MQFLKKIYFMMCYNSNRVLNFNAILRIFFPLLLLFMFQGRLLAIFQILVIIIIATILYVFVYLINDLIDLKKDKAEWVYKFSLYSEYRISLVFYSVVYALCVFVAIFLLWFFEIFPLSLIWGIAWSAFVLILLSLVHSFFPSLKKYTLFWERALKFLLPLWFVHLLYPDLNYFTSVCVILPYLLDEAYVGYLLLKRKLKESEKYSVYLLYYVLLLVYYIFLPFEISVFMLLCFLALFFLLQILYSFFVKDWGILRKIYGENSDARSQVLTEILINGFLLIVIVGWACVL